MRSAIAQHSRKNRGLLPEQVLVTLQPAIARDVRLQRMRRVGFYWARERASVEADAGSGARPATRVGGIINRGSAGLRPMHNPERQVTFTAIWSRFSDDAS